MAIVKKTAICLSKFQEVLQYFTEEDIMLFYGIESSSYKRYCNVFRIDITPSCTCSWYKGKLIFKDWATNKAYSVIGVAALKYGLLTSSDDDYIPDEMYQAVVDKMYSELVEGKTLAKIDTSLSNHQDVEKTTTIKVVARMWTEADSLYWGAGERTLKENNIYAIQYAIVNGTRTMFHQIGNPSYAYYFPKHSASKQVWKIYKPMAKSFANSWKWVSNTEMHYPSLFLRGSPTKTLCTSAKDAFTFSRLIGASSYSFQGEGYKPKPTDILSNTTRIIIDNDKAGRTLGEYCERQHGLTVTTPIHKDIYEDWLKLSAEEFLTHYTI